MGTGGRLITAHLTQFVRAPIERVYGAYVDPTVMPKWMGLKEVTDVSGPIDRAGTTFVEVVFRWHRPRAEVLAAERPLLHDMGGRTYGITWRWTAHFATRDDGTEITLDAAVNFPADPISWWLRRTQEAANMEQGTAGRLAVFAGLVEEGERQAGAKAVEGIDR